LLEFEGTVIVVSHDRYFLNRVVDVLVVLEGDGRSQVVYGNYDTYVALRAQQEAAAAEKEARRQEAAAASKPAAPAPATTARGKPKRKFPYRKVEELEADIAAAEAELRDVEAKLASPDLYREGDKVKEVTQAFEDVKVKLAQLYEHWEE